MTGIVAVDVGGTHARFALATVESGRVLSVGPECTLNTADYAGLEGAWAAFGATLGDRLPKAAAIALAAPLDGERLKVTNNHWVIDAHALPESLGVERYSLVNDFAAVAFAVAQLDDSFFRPLCGPERVLPSDGVVSIVGPGTGLGVGQLLRRGGRDHVIATEGGHIGFAPLDALEDRILEALRKLHPRVSVERIVSGPGLANLYRTLAAMEGRQPSFEDEKALWSAAIGGTDDLAAAALDRFCLTLGAVAGDIALAHGANAVVIGGGLGLRLADHLPRSGFAERFAAKGRYAARMTNLPVKIVTHPHPGLFGAAAAFAAEHDD